MTGLGLITMRQRPIMALILGATIGALVPARAETPAETLPVRAEALAGVLAAACPLAPYDNEAAFKGCSRTLDGIDMGFAPTIAWGGDQPDKPIKDKGLTLLNSRVFQTMYLPLFAFTGQWSLDRDPVSHSPIIRLQAYFRNRLPSGDFPYPFWHSAAKWAAYETANEIRLYLDGMGKAFVVTRGSAGSEDRRGVYPHAETPVFAGAWQWSDKDGTQQPHVSLFSARYDSANPYLPALDQTYRTFALRIRDQSCLDCHTPANTAASQRLVLLQTPLHAAGAIENVIDAVSSGEMPQDDIGLRKEIADQDRAAVLTAAIAFRDELAKADAWEGAQPR